ncbi:hypothetical protein [Aeoliella mucimassa]|uniref:Uncharacterized protein n=1 Tax=Aeoliella mucimassa TaxID=2527972 RepID=A0A518AHS3_9BACT|nr:hypothetical protein [Aeoliella mucimassa]QDU54286.1 hypothetical protein Pan181_04670 [Aeoliella mucimassa]
MDLQAFSNWTGTTDELFDRLTHELAAAGRWHELFEARLMAARARLGIPLALLTNSTRTVEARVG